MVQQQYKASLYYVLLFASWLLQHGAVVQAFTVASPSSNAASSAREYYNGLSITDVARLWKIPNAAEKQNKKTLSKQKKVSYDLGLGKNAPVAPPSSSSTAAAATFVRRRRRPSTATTTTKNVYQATKYLVEHMAVNELPSPHHRQEQQQQLQGNDEAARRTMTTKSNNKKKNFPPVVLPTRTTRDSDLKLHAQKRVLVGSLQDFDLNTAWIELLIHEQQQQYFQTAASSLN